jgi:serralysin
MVVRVPLSGDQRIDGVLWGGWKWDTTALPYSFPTSKGVFSGYNAVEGYEAFSSAQIKITERALAQVSSFTNLTFFGVENGTGGVGLRFGEATKIDANDGYGLHVPGDDSAEATPPDPDAFPVPALGDNWFSHGIFERGAPGTYENIGIMHEVGHSLGLKHGQQENKLDGEGANTTLLPEDSDGQAFSIMTYRSYPGQIADEDGYFLSPVDYSTTYMMYDMRALQYLYGANYNYNSGDNIYTWNSTTGEMSVNGAKYNKSTNALGGEHDNYKIFMTIWDGGGFDIYNFSNFRNGIVANLNPGAWSTPESKMRADLGEGRRAPGNVANALLVDGDIRSIIEGVVGGRGNDRLTGNFVNNFINGRAGNDKLFGLSGDDSILGGKGNDALTGGAGNDLLVGGAGADVLDGGLGADTFDYNSVSHSVKGSGTRDSVIGFDPVDDKFDLSGIDAIASTPEDDVFVFIDANGFSAAGQVRFLQEGNTAALQVNTDGVGKAEMVVKIFNFVAGTAVDESNFIL